MHVQTLMGMTSVTAPALAAFAVSEVLAEAREKHGDLPPILTEFVDAVEKRTGELLVEFGEAAVEGGKQGG